MSAKPENSFIAGVHRLLPPTLYRMKNHNQFNAGIADVWYSGPKRDLWIEYKFLVPPKLGATVIDLCGGKHPMLSLLQQQWLAARHHEGRDVAVVVGTPKGGAWFEPLKWTEPLTTAKFMTMLTPRPALADRIAKFTGASP